MLPYDYDEALRNLLRDINRVKRPDGDWPSTEENVSRALMRIYDILWALTRQP